MVFRKGVFKWVARAILFTVAVLTLYCWHLSSLIEERFSGRRWSIPSTIYSDITICYPGQDVNKALLYEKLARLGYREIDNEAGKLSQEELQGQGYGRELVKYSEKFARDEGFGQMILHAQDVSVVFYEKLLKTFEKFGKFWFFLVFFGFFVIKRLKN